MNNELLQPLNQLPEDYQRHTGRSSSILEKLRDMFEPTDFVRVINPDTEKFIWQYLPESKERIDFDTTSSTVPQKITHRDSPEVYLLEPGQSAVIVGANAYLMIDGLVKRMMSKKIIARRPNVKPGEARNFNFSDDQGQLDWIGQIYLGKATPYMSTSAPAPQPRTNEDDIDKELGIESSEVSAKRGRRASQAAARVS